MASQGDGIARQTIDLRVVSPSPELRNGFTFLEISTSTTIAELKLRIHREIAPYPRVDRQRLIYRGRALQRDGDTLLDVFGEATIREDQLHVLHLVIPERHIHPPANTPGVASAQSRPPSIPPVAPPNPFRPASATNTGSPQSGRNPFRPLGEEQQVPHGHPFNLPPNARVNTNVNITAHGPNGAPVQLSQDALNNILTHHFAAQGAMLQGGFPHGLHQMPMPGQDGAAGQPTFTHPHSHPIPATSPAPSTGSSRLNTVVRTEAQTPFQQFIAQQQQERAATDAQGLGTDVAQSSNPLGHLVPHGPETEAEQNAVANPLQPANGDVPVPGAGPVSDLADGSNVVHPTLVSTDTVPLAAQPAAIPTAPQSSANPTAPQSAVNPAAAQPAAFPQAAQVLMGPNMHSTFTITQFQHGAPRPPFPAGQVHQFQPPFPFPQHPAVGQHPGLAAARAGTPPAGLMPSGMSRSGTPSRTSSDGIRQLSGSGAPSHHETMMALHHSHRNIHDLNRMLDVLSMARTGRALAPQEIEGLRMRARALTRELEALGAAFNSTPLPMLPPDRMQAQLLWQSLMAQAQGFRQRIDALAPQNQNSNGTSVTGTSATGTPVAGIPAAGTTAAGISAAAATQQSRQTGPSQSPNTSEVPIQSTPFPPPPVVHNLVAPGQSTVDGSSIQPQLYLLQTANGQPQALVVGPAGSYATPYLPPELSGPLMNTQLPAAQIVQTFTDTLRTALAPGGLLHFGALQTLIPPQTTLRDTARTVERRLRAQARIERAAAAAAQANNNVAQGVGVPADADLALGGQQVEQAIAGNLERLNARNGGAGAAVQARPPDEMRDVLAPIVRNLWLLVRLFAFFWFVGLSGKSLYRPVGLVLVVFGLWALQWGIPRQYVERAQQWWQGLIDPVRQRDQDAVRQQQQQGQPPSGAPAANAAAPPAAASSSAAIASNTAATQSTNPPTPRDAATRLLAERERRNWDWLVERRRAVERTAALFFASLVPGFGENFVRQIEERERQEREERERLEREVEEARRSEEEARNDEEASAADVGLESTAVQDVHISHEDSGIASGADAQIESGVSRVNKGKQKATEAEVEKQETGPATGAAAASKANEVD